MAQGFQTEASRFCTVVLIDFIDQMKSKGGSVRQKVTLTSWACRNFASSKANDKRLIQNSKNLKLKKL